MHETLFKSLAIFLYVALLAACSGPATPAPTPTPTPVINTAGAAGGLRTFVIVPSESKAMYLVDEEFFSGALAKYGIAAGDSDVVGTTQEFEGQIQLNLDDLSSALGDNHFTVRMDTLTTDRELRDSWIRENGPRFNDYPLATFQATSIEGAPESYTEGDEIGFQLLGDLTIREITQPVTFNVTATLTGDTLTGVATTRLLMSDFGIEPPNFANTLTVADEFGIEVHFTAREQ